MVLAPPLPKPEEPPVVLRKPHVRENAIMMSSSTRLRSAWLGFTVLLVTTFALACAATSQAQVLNDPRVAEFDPSPDHWVTLSSGASAVLRYELAVYPLGVSAQVGTVDMGKPSPDADGKIRFDFSSHVAAWSLPGGEYEARVSAIGPEGAALSDPSNPFTFSSSSPCRFSLSATTVSASASGGNYGVDVSTGTGCDWAVANALPWVNAWTGGGSGSGTVPVEVQANPTSSSRTGTIDIAGQTLTVSQAAGTSTCSYSLSAGSASVPAAGGSASFFVTAGSGCSWTAATSQSWIAIAGSGVAADSSAGSTVSLTVAPNASTASRTGTVSVQGQVFTVTQAGAAPACTYSLSPASASVPAAGGSASFFVTAGSGCSWTAATSQSWIAIAGGAAPASTVSVTVAPNASTASRTGTVSVQGQVFTVTQAGAAPACTYSLSRGSASVPAAGGSASFTVTAGSGCSWTAATSQSWIAIAGSGVVADRPAGSTVSLTVAPNSSTASRTGTVSVQGQDLYRHPGRRRASCAATASRPARPTCRPRVAARASP